MSQATIVEEDEELLLEQGIPYDAQADDGIDAQTRGRHVSVVTSPTKMGDVYKLRDKRLNQMRRLRSMSNHSDTSYDGSVDTGSLFGCKRLTHI